MTILQNLQKILEPIDVVVESGKIARYNVTDYNSDLPSPAFVSYRVTVHDAARFELSLAILRVNDCTISIELDLQGVGAQADILLLYGLSEQQNIKINTIQKHHGQKTTSTVIARGIVTDQARVAYHGMISLQPGSVQADAKQEHTTIVLSKSAKVVSIPSIEVLHHDVQCSHGAAIGQFHEQQLWYLQSRGFEKKVAYQMLVKSFFAEYMDRFSLPCHPRSTLGSRDKKSFSDQLLESLCQKIL